MGMIDKVIGVLGMMMVVEFVVILVEAHAGASSERIDILAVIALTTGLISIAGLMYVWITEHRLVGE